ncbi:protein zwilch homolog [Daphnia pulex]|uniref:protein zwilch homolog n=1 Tax=Daphnia pulex TaxID=6669 RepID=UPI001EDDA88C|nr:protein zwilch homolog [Daphnia pulex]
MKLTTPAFQSMVLSQLPIHSDFLSFIRKKECLFVFKDKVVPVQKKVQSPKIQPIIEPEVEVKSLQEQMDMAGTPLECPFDLDVLKIQDEDFYSKESMDSHHKSELKSCRYKPFSSFEARGILSNFILDTSLQSALPVFCLCDAEDGERTSILGIEKGKNNELTHYKITVAGPITATHTNIQFDHLKSEMAFMTQVGEFSTRAFAVYEAYRGINFNAEPDVSVAYVRLECSWMKPSKVLEFPHIASQAKVIVRPLPGETCSGAYEIWRQLNTLQHLIKGLESLEIVWFVKTSQKTLREEIDKLISAFCKDETDQLKGKMDYEELYDEQQLIYKRTPMDFIDHLWELLSQNCSSFSELSQSLQYTLQRAKSDHPMVFFDNPTRFGKMLRQNDALPQFTGMEPVSLLIEMGIEKLKRDYLYIFSGNNLVAERVISMFLPQDGTAFGEQLNCLTSIQSAVEVVCLCHRVLQLPHLALRDVITPLLEHYRNPDNLGKEFSFQLGVCLLKGFFQHQESGSSVEKWRVEFTSTTDCHPVKLACQLTANNLLDASSAGDEEAVGERLYSVERYLTKTQQLL